jgi:hypothetical protein
LRAALKGRQTSPLDHWRERVDLRIRRKRKRKRKSTSH